MTRKGEGTLGAEEEEEDEGEEGEEEEKKKRQNCACRWKLKYIKLLLFRMMMLRGKAVTERG